jgi:hypothetical protein
MSVSAQKKRHNPPQLNPHHPRESFVSNSTYCASSQSRPALARAPRAHIHTKTPLSKSLESDPLVAACLGQNLKPHPTLTPAPSNRQRRQWQLHDEHVQQHGCVNMRASYVERRHPCMQLTTHARSVTRTSLQMHLPSRTHVHSRARLVAANACILTYCHALPR